MKMIASENFKEALLGVLNKLRKSQIKSDDGISIKYPLTINATKIAQQFNGFEREALKFLTQEKVIKEVGERTDIELGNPGEKDHDFYQSLNIKVLQPLETYYEKLSSKSSSINSGALLFHITSGKTSYMGIDGNKITITFNPNTIQYQVIFNVLSSLGKNISYDECIKGTTNKRIHSETNSEEKTRNALKSIRRQFRKSGLDNNKVSSIFITQYGVSIGIPYTIIP